jgi:hypothetical protein
MREILTAEVSMSDHIAKTIEELKLKVAEHEANASRTKHVINDLCGMAGMEKLYADINVPKTANSTHLRGDEYYGKGQATAVREYLEWRKAVGKGPGMIDEIHDALKAGGYQFDEKLGKRGMAIAIAKNTQTFHKLPNGKIGLKDWYPDLKDAKFKKATEETITGNDDKSEPTAEK